MISSKNFRLLNTRLTSEKITQVFKLKFLDAFSCTKLRNEKGIFLLKIDLISICLRSKINQGI